MYIDASRLVVRVATISPPLVTRLSIVQTRRVDNAVQHWRIAAVLHAASNGGSAGTRGVKPPQPRIEQAWRITPPGLSDRTVYCSSGYALISWRMNLA